jgi:hypothetical protein
MWNPLKTGPKPLDQRVAEMEHRMILLEQEWTATLDQVSRFFARHRKRTRDELREASEAAGAAPPNGDSFPSGPAPRTLPGGVMARRGGH